MRGFIALIIIFSITFTNALLNDPNDFSNPRQMVHSDAATEIALDPEGQGDQAFVQSSQMSPPDEEDGPIWPWTPDCLDAERDLILCCNSAFIFGTAFGCSLWGRIAVCERTNHIFCCSRQEWFLGRDCRFAYIPA